MISIGDMRRLPSGRVLRIEEFELGGVRCTYCTHDGLRLGPPELHEVVLTREFLLAHGKRMVAAVEPSS